nr:DNA-binding domain-containing protein [Sphingomonas alba]
MQSGFRDWLLDGDDQFAAQLGSGARAGLDVYRNNYRSQLRTCLEVAYPMTLEWIGWTRFEAAVADHIDSVTPRSWTLDAYPADFPATLKRQLPDAPECHELAEFEWALSEAFVSGDEPGISMEGCEGIDWDAARLNLAPSFKILHQDTNATDIWSAIKHDRPIPSADTSETSRTILVWRSDEVCQFRRAEPLEGKALEMLSSGARFGEVCDTVCAALTPDVAIESLGKWLGQWFSDGCIVGTDTA